MLSPFKRALSPETRQAEHRVEVDGRSVRFSLATPASRRFFLPRYADGRLHEAGATHVLDDWLTPSSTFLDVGSNLGWFSMVAAGACRTVYAVEAQEAAVAQVRVNADLNGFANVHTLNVAAGEGPGFVVMPVEGRPGTSVATSGEGRRVPVIALDDYFADDPPDVVKIDVEGFELSVLRGARRLLATGPKLMIELHKAMAQFGADPRDVIALLTDAGYTIRTGAHRSKTIELADISSDGLPDNLNNTMIFCERAGEVRP